MSTDANRHTIDTIGGAQFGLAVEATS